MPVPRRELATAAKWRMLGRLLPKDVRERIFEPAFADLLHRHLRGGGGNRIPFGLSVIATGLGCAPVAVRWLFVRNGTLTRGSWVVLVSLASLLIVVLLLRHFTRIEAGY